MSIVVNGSGTITGISTGGLNDGIIADADIASMSASKLTGALPAISGAALTGISSVGGASGVDFNDSVKARFGTGNDLEIYHDASHSYISDTGTGNLKLMTSYLEVNQTNGEEMFKAIGNAGCHLYYDNSVKLVTTSTGINVTGAVNSTGEMRISNPSATSQLYLYGAAGQKANLKLNEYGVRDWDIGAGTVTSGQFSISAAGTERLRIDSSGVVKPLTSFQLPSLASAPSSPAAGNLYYNTGTKKVIIYNGSAWETVGPPNPEYRYTRYNYVSASVGHHPRISRIFIIQDNGTHVQVYNASASDNCSDSGDIPSGGTTYTHDAGAGVTKGFTGFGWYSVYGGGNRGANIKLEGSSDNSSWTQIGSTTDGQTSSNCGEQTWSV
jgi:hypothetical protein